MHRRTSAATASELSADVSLHQRSSTLPGSNCPMRVWTAGGSYMMFGLGLPVPRQVVLLATRRLRVKATSDSVLYLDLCRPTRAQHFAHGREYLPPEPTKPSFRSPGLRCCLMRSLKAL